MPAVDTMASPPATSAKETKQSIADLEGLLQKLSVSKSQDEANGAAGNVATFLNGPIEEHDVPLKAVETLKKQLANKKDAVVRERALDGIKAIASHGNGMIAPGVEPYLVSLLPLSLAAVG